MLVTVKEKPPMLSDSPNVSSFGTNIVNGLGSTLKNKPTVSAYTGITEHGYSSTRRPGFSTHNDPVVLILGVVGLGACFGSLSYFQSMGWPAIVAIPSSFICGVTTPTLLAATVIGSIVLYEKLTGKTSNKTCTEKEKNSRRT